MSDLLPALGVGSLGFLAITSGGVFRSLRTPSDRARSVIQHIAAGAVFAGLTADVLQRLLTGHDHLGGVIGGMALGLTAMMAIRIVMRRKHQEAAAVAAAWE